jgi:hypothetical protein
VPPLLCQIWLAAAKLEWESNEIERARAVLQRARARAPSDRVFMKCVLLERECENKTAEQVCGAVTGRCGVLWQGNRSLGA